MASPTKSRVKHKKFVKKQADFIKIAGSARRYKNTKTGKTISRREYEKLFPPQALHKKLGRAKAAKRIKENRTAQRRYQRLLEDYIRNNEREFKGAKISKRATRASPAFKSIVRDLKSKSPTRKADALFRSGRITSDEIERYKHIFQEENAEYDAQHIYYAISKETGKRVYSGSEREVYRWLKLKPSRKKYFELKQGALRVDLK